MTTYRAAFVLPAVGSNGASLLLTTQEHSSLNDEELMFVARQVAAANDVVGEIVIGDWKAECDRGVASSSTKHGSRDAEL
ncbi:hypothetical protein [Caballeronia grimmiae]|uniref:hypothetical protein n=1 Tax=Caballeronia grimmiae TaxID=1071679 RepID=UPI0038BAB7C4